MIQKELQLQLKKGIKAGFPVAMGYLPVAVAFGLVSRASGMPYYSGLLMSLLVFAGASQFVGINLLALGASALEVGVATFLLNLRHLLMTSADRKSTRLNSSH